MQELHSFAELGELYGIKPKQRREKEFTCKVCGGKMTHINNILICENPHKRKNKDGGTEEFEYFVIQRVRRNPTGLLAPGAELNPA